MHGVTMKFDNELL